ncbi:hypothetical protein BO94DRAFT_330848 [Aspergillus sclerotioniger CBS 115572]|uniref:Secreted protein n=1 Tax=Aspergillus sclerotioniger CBS 115572 TaxID=1450535 RepID=A0A317UXR4_9EURO|nr:hypothetical protein BO94DRAFT_330848 [Aspergillus sclerotioniger CBS 115572]PWY66834.1 hypothetical protein BO94DRAFT_330848 [Aspergillus sclerotioniger CBS 115572]
MCIPSCCLSVFVLGTPLVQITQFLCRPSGLDSCPGAKCSMRIPIHAHDLEYNINECFYSYGCYVQFILLGLLIHVSFYPYSLYE